MAEEYDNIHTLVEGEYLIIKINKKHPNFEQILKGYHIQHQLYNILTNNTPKFFRGEDKGDHILIYTENIIKVNMPVDNLELLNLTHVNLLNILSSLHNTLQKVHGDFTDTNILFNGKNIYIVDFDNWGELSFGGIIQDYYDFCRTLVAKFNIRENKILIQSLKFIDIIDNQLKILVDDWYDIGELDESIIYQLIKKLAEEIKLPISAEISPSQLSQLFNNYFRNPINSLHETKGGGKLRFKIKYYS